MDTYKSQGVRIPWTEPGTIPRSSGDVVVLADMLGICVADIALSGTGVLEIGRCHELAATSADAWSVGDQLYWDTDNEALTNVAGAFPPAGIAADAKAALDVHARVILNMNHGLSAYTVYDYTSLAAALAAVTSSNNKIMLMPGSYTLTASLTMPAHDCALIGLGGKRAVDINAAAAVTPLINIAPDTLSGTATYSFDGLFIDNGETSQVGIQVDNADAGKKIIVTVDNCEFSDGGNAIDVDHDGGSDAVRLYCEGCYVEGAINFDVGDGGDRIRCLRCQLIGGLVTGTDATTCEILLENCRVLHEGVTGGDGAQTVNAVACVSDDDAGTYAALDTDDLAGSHTENII